MTRLDTDLAALNVLSGVTTVNKFGRNPDIDTTADEDIWDGGGTWVAPTQARIHDIASTEAADTAAGTGARTVSVQGLDGNYDLTSETVTLNGASNVATTNSYVIIFRIKVESVGSSGANAGVITATAQTDATVTAQVSAGKNQTLMAVYQVPAGYTALMDSYYATMNVNPNKPANSVANIALYFKPFSATETTGYQIKHINGLSLVGNSHLFHLFKPRLKISEKTIIKIRAEDISDNDTDISAGFDLLLIKNDTINSWY